MNTKTVFDRLQSIDDEVQKLHNTIFALKTTDIQAYADKYEELSISAALRSERIACQLRNPLFLISCFHSVLCNNENVPSILLSTFSFTDYKYL